MAALLDIDNLSVSYGSLLALQEVTCQVRQGTVVAVIGANGAGKTTLLRAISGLLPSNEGEVSFDGRSITGLPAYRVARLGIRHVPEGRGIFRSLTVRENLAIQCNQQQVAFAEGLERVTEMFPVLKQRLGQRAGTLSGGEQQMLALAPIFVKVPRLLLLDEITAGLAPSLASQLYAAIRKLAKEGQTILIVEQYVNVALDLAQHVYVLKKGRILWDGPPRDVERQSLWESYLK